MKSKRKRIQTQTLIVRKCDYEDMAVCIKSDQVRPADVAEYFKDKSFYRYYKKNWLNK
jgi:hypothetical protein